MVSITLPMYVFGNYESNKDYLLPDDFIKNGNNLVDSHLPSYTRWSLNKNTLSSRNVKYLPFVTRNFGHGQWR